MARTRTKSIGGLRRQMDNIYTSARRIDPNISYDGRTGRYVSSSENQTTVNRLNSASDTFNRYRRNMEQSAKGRRLAQQSRDAFNRYDSGSPNLEKAYANVRNAQYSRRTYMGLSNG